MPQPASRTLVGAAPAIKDLIGVTRNHDQWFRAHAAETLGGIGPEARTAVRALVELLGHHYADARMKAARALGAIGVKDDAVLTALRKARQDKDEKVVNAAKDALKALGH